MRLIVIGLVAVGCWTVAAFVAWALVRVGTRYQPPEDVPPPEPVTILGDNLTTADVAGVWIDWHRAGPN